MDPLIDASNQFYQVLKTKFELNPRISIKDLNTSHLNHQSHAINSFAVYEFVIIITLLLQIVTFKIKDYDRVY